MPVELALLSAAATARERRRRLYWNVDWVAVSGEEGRHRTDLIAIPVEAGVTPGDVAVVARKHPYVQDAILVNEGRDGPYVELSFTPESGAASTETAMLVFVSGLFPELIYLITTVSSVPATSQKICAIGVLATSLITSYRIQASSIRSVAPVTFLSLTAVLIGAIMVSAHTAAHTQIEYGVFQFIAFLLPWWCLTAAVVSSRVSRLPFSSL